MNCKNCGDLIGNERNLDDKFCSDQCKVEYELEHNKKWNILFIAQYSTPSPFSS
jgi:predicted nucleic acid-binding Zn ribbon protein